VSGLFLFLFFGFWCKKNLYFLTSVPMCEFSEKSHFMKKTDFPMKFRRKKSPGKNRLKTEFTYNTFWKKTRFGLSVKKVAIGTLFLAELYGKAFRAWEMRKLGFELEKSLRLYLLSTQ